MEKTRELKDDEIGMPYPAGSINFFEKEYTDFIDIAVHDLDAPLRKLVVLTGMLSGKLSPDKDVRSYIERIESCVGDMRSLIDDLSRLAQVSSGKRKLISCDLGAIVRQSVQDLPRTLKTPAINIASLPVVAGDAVQYSRVFTNILENAIKFSKKEQFPEIDIQSSVLSVEEKAELNLSVDRSYYKIVIADNGIGFKNENAEKIFRPFVRLHGKAQFAGNGIGLAICKRIIDNHQGVIYAEGRESEGAKFILIIPESHHQPHA